MLPNEDPPTRHIVLCSKLLQSNSGCLLVIVFEIAHIIIQTTTLFKILLRNKAPVHHCEQKPSLAISACQQQLPRTYSSQQLIELKLAGSPGWYWNRSSSSLDYRILSWAVHIYIDHESRVLWSGCFPISGFVEIRHSNWHFHWKWHIVESIQYVSSSLPFLFSSPWQQTSFPEISLGWSEVKLA